MTQAVDNQPKWYSLTPEAVGKELQVDPAKGLSAAEAKQRLQKYGPNEMAAKKKESGWHAFLRQYQDFMQILLLAAAALSLVVTRELGTTVMLVALTVFNAFLGLRGESKAQASLDALQKMMKNTARVRRDGEAIDIDASEVVPGDVAMMEAGDSVPADGRLFLAASVEIQESALTGESTASAKNTETIDKADVPLGDRHCMAYMNTAVTHGRAEMMVTTTGMGTQMGQIADLLNKTESDKTPLQKQLDKLTIIIAGVAGLAFVLMVILGLSRGESFDMIFVAGIALAISAIPTGMPAVVTTMYSMGARALADMGAIVKRLPSVETLGSVSAVCTDKTGTLTLNKMTAREFVVPGLNRYKVTGEGYGTQGTFQPVAKVAGKDGQKGSAASSTDGKILSAGGTRVDLDEILLPMALCADARLDGSGGLIGDPTEGALIVLAEKGGIDVDSAREQYPRLAEIPFDAEYKFMATFHNMTNAQGEAVVRGCVKGAPDVLISRGGSYWQPEGKLVPITDESRSLALDQNERIGELGERVMVVARRDYDPQTFDPKANLMDLVTDLTLLAIVGIVDPPRAEAKDAIAKCHDAGIQVRMITGDHAVTAIAIGRELGIEGTAMTGAQFAATSDDELLKNISDLAIVARVAPEDKVHLVTLLQQSGNIVSMTGDGVNDAPALKKADIGVAMGITGTEVSKGAAVMILTDDNFATIVKAIEYGRGIYSNLSHFIRYQMLSLVAFIASYLGAALFAIAGGVPFTTAVVLWINFLVTVPMAIALGFDKPAPGLMKDKPRPLSQPVLTGSQWVRIAFMGIVMAASTLILEAAYEPARGTNAVATTMGFAVFGLTAVMTGFSSRSEFQSAFGQHILQDKNQALLYGLALLMILLPTELAFLQRILGTTSLGGDQWLICLGFALAWLLLDEVVKFFMRRSRQHQAA